MIATIAPPVLVRCKGQSARVLDNMQTLQAPFAAELSGSLSNAAGHSWHLAPCSSATQKGCGKGSPNSISGPTDRRATIKCGDPSHSCSLTPLPTVLSALSPRLLARPSP